MNIPRVLIDTNILLSGLIWDGNESRLLEMSIGGEICLLIPEFVIGEARRVLELKFKEHVHLLDEVLGLLNYALLQHPSEESIESVRTILRDPNDTEILASIIEYKPDYALTGDKDLLTNDVQSIFPTCRCADFLHEFKRD